MFSYLLIFFSIQNCAKNILLLIRDSRLMLLRKRNNYAIPNKFFKSEFSKTHARTERFEVATHFHLGPMIRSP